MLGSTVISFDNLLNVVRLCMRLNMKNGDTDRA
jgi:hypothetical protein